MCDRCECCLLTACFNVFLFSPPSPQVREGEQHALWDHVQSFAEVYKVGQGMIQQLANVVNQRLPKVAAQINIDVGGGRSIPLRVAIGQTHPRQVDKTIEAFCEVHGLNPEAVVPAIRQGVMGKLHSDALVAPGQPYRG